MRATGLYAYQRGKTEMNAFIQNRYVFYWISFATTLIDINFQESIFQKFPQDDLIMPPTKATCNHPR